MKWTRSPRLAWTRSKSGISRRHGVHHEAKKLTTTGRPRNASSDAVDPSRVSYCRGPAAAARSPPPLSPHAPANSTRHNSARRALARTVWARTVLDGIRKPTEADVIGAGEAPVRRPLRQAGAR